MDLIRTHGFFKNCFVINNIYLSYIIFLCGFLLYTIFSLIIASVWSVLDRGKVNYDRLLQWLVMLVRYYVIYQMLIYGFAKLFYLQFQPPRFARLIQPYGDSSPMGILWTFMGQSKGYTM